MKVFLDTNTLLDLLLDRRGCQDVAELFRLQEEGTVQLCTSVTTMVNIAYVYNKTLGHNELVAGLRNLADVVEVLPLDNQILQRAVLIKGLEFEDSMQIVCASLSSCAYLITCTPKVYHIPRYLAHQLSLPPVLSPTAFLARHHSENKGVLGRLLKGRK